MPANILKAYNYYKENGFISLIKKTVDYTVFLIKKIKLIAVLKKGNLKIICGGNGVRIFYNGIHLTNMHGLNTVLNVLTQWHESSECLWTIKNKTQNTVDITVKFKYVPVSQIWHIKILSDRKILWKVDIIAEQDLEIDCYKAGFFLSSEYKRWVCGDDEGTFSKINNFERQIKNGSFEDYFLGVRNYQNKNYGYLPGFFIDFSKTRALCFSSILNSNVLLNSRMIYITIDLPRQLKQGRYNLLNFKIIIEEKDSEIEKKIEHLRQLKVKKYENSIG